MNHPPPAAEHLQRQTEQGSCERLEQEGTACQHGLMVVKNPGTALSSIMMPCLQGLMVCKAKGQLWVVFTKKSRPASQQIPGTHLPLPTLFWDFKNLLLSLAFYRVLGTWVAGTLMFTKPLFQL